MNFQMGIHNIDPIFDAMSASTGDEENTDEINNTLAAFRDSLIKVWDRKNVENKKVLLGKNRETFFLPLIEALDFKKLLLDKILASPLNNSNNGDIKLKAHTNPKMRVEINFLNKQITLNGKMAWESKREYKPTTKIVDVGGTMKEGITPSISRLGATAQGIARLKEKHGKSTELRVTASGTIVLEEGNYVDIKRMEWLDEIVDNITNLRRLLL